MLRIARIESRHHTSDGSNGFVTPLPESTPSTVDGEPMVAMKYEAFLNPNIHLGLHVEQFGAGTDIVVTAVKPMTQSAAQGVIEGSRIISINSVFVQNNLDLVFDLIKQAQGNNTFVLIIFEIEMARPVVQYIKNDTDMIYMLPDFIEEALDPTFDPFASIVTEGFVKRERPGPPDDDPRKRHCCRATGRF